MKHSGSENQPSLTIKRPKMHSFQTLLLDPKIFLPILTHSPKSSIKAAPKHIYFLVPFKESFAGNTK